MSRHAVVLGAGMSGLLAARVLSECFERVTVIDRDPLPDGPAGRRGVPQGRHVHGFQARGVQIVDELFPGVVPELVGAGASRLGDLSALHFRVAGHLLCQRPQPIAPILLATRPYLEYAIRRRVAELAGVTFRDGLEIAGLRHVWRGSAAVITGVSVVPPGGGRTEDIAADLVMDATGRGSRTPVWLWELGYERPAEERIVVRVKYASQTLRLPTDAGHPRFTIEGRSPSRDLGVALFGCEDDRWTFTVMGAERAFGKPTREWMLGVAEEVLAEPALAVVRAAEPDGPVATYQHPASVRRRYDRLSRFPAGLVVVGDGLCAFNPIYGTGMSVAAEQALALRSTLAHGSTDVMRRFLRVAAAPMNAAWELAAGSDLAYPDVEGEPTRAMRLAGRYLERVLRAAEHDAEVARRFVAVAGLVAPRTSLFAPRVVAAVLRDRRREYHREEPALLSPVPRDAVTEGAR